VSDFLNSCAYLATNAAAQGEGCTLLHYASRQGYLNIVKNLFAMEVSVDVELRDHLGCTALHHASQHGFLSDVKF
jgi:ankyrin repeat protein